MSSWPAQVRAELEARLTPATRARWDGLPERLRCAQVDYIARAGHKRSHARWLREVVGFLEAGGVPAPGHGTAQGVAGGLELLLDLLAR